MEGDTAVLNGGQQNGHGPRAAVSNNDTNTQAHAPIAADSEHLQVIDVKASVEDGDEHSNTATSHLPSPRLTASDLAARAAHNTDITSAKATNGTTGPEPSNDRLTPVNETLPSATPTEPFVPFVHLLTPEPESQPTAAPAQPLSPNHSKTRSRSGTKTAAHDGVRRLSASKIQELTNAPESLPIATAPDRQPAEPTFSPALAEVSSRLQSQLGIANGNGPNTTSTRTHPQRPTIAPRTVSTPPVSRRLTATAAQQAHPAQQASIRRNSYQPNPRPPPLDLDGTSNFDPGAEPRAGPPPRQPEPDPAPPSPIPQSIPLPPMSVPTLLQLELAGSRPSPLYIHHSYTSDIPYESSAIKFERLKNFLILPFVLERSITFGALACLDAWLWTFTILPMRFGIAVSILLQWWGYVIGKETRWLVGFVWYGLGRMWRRGRRGRSESVASTDGQRSRSQSRVREQPVNNSTSATTAGADTRHPNLRMAPGTKPPGPSRRGRGYLGHRRTKSNPSNLTHYNKADLLQGAVVIVSSIALMSLDASRMYHSIRAQSAIKLYTIYNLLEVGDRLLAALGQDIFECLFSNETLSRDSLGRSKVLLPLGIFCLALVYNILHAVILFYQVIALNVAVNSYSNTLLTLLMSNQFVEIKSAVFKRFEKENTFQMACADIVERFQLWIMLLIIAMRNVVEVGGLSVPGYGSEDAGPSSFPLHTASILPASFTILPSWLWSGEVLSPFVVVIGSEMVVDWIKHAYVIKFNNIKPNFYSRILDILCKDYYTNAFVTPQLTRRLGLPLLPLSCLFIRASFQIYNMFVAVHVPTPLPPSTQTSLSVDSATPSPAMLAALDRLDKKIRIALGRAVYGYPFGESGGLGDNVSGPASAPIGDIPEPAGLATHIWHSVSKWLPEWKWTSDDVIAFLTMITVFLLIFLVLLIFKLLLGMLLLRYSRDRYARMKVKEAAIAAGQAEKESFETKGKRVGGFGQVEVGEERRRWIFADDPKGLNKVREREKGGGGGKGGGGKQEKDLGTVMRYEMIAKRIW
ncbi:eukaryotic membrane protein family-domain-containing protein [Neurospora tetraspora]|uniref:Eukaryotic membrane protein family-domain-containing protein n=1 Tax=Neurospora tetraspora TaxID=94610 RepID=A0AAE0MQP5_9PEZI|nr:eukaryotic membrane protein family-domain-containing protein [Neurospora tetraspora]